MDISSFALTQDSCFLSEETREAKLCLTKIVSDVAFLLLPVNDDGIKDSNQALVIALRATRLLGCILIYYLLIVVGD